MNTVFKFNIFINLFYVYKGEVYQLGFQKYSKDINLNIAHINIKLKISTRPKYGSDPNAHNY